MEENLNIQVKKLLELQEELKQKPLSLDELKQVALSSGIQEFEWNEMLKKAEEYTEQAQQHLQFGNYYDALDSASDAATINPYLTKAMLLASEAALKIYQTEDKDEYLEKAEYFAREILKLSPSESRAIKILASIENFERKEKSDDKKKIILYSAIIISIIIISFSIFYIVNKPPKIDSKTKNQLFIAQEDAKSQWAQVENVMNRRDNLIPELISLAPNNTQTTKLNKEIEQLKTELKTADEYKRIEIQAILQNKLRELSSLITKNNNSKQLELLMIQIEGTYNRISVETKRYNEKVKIYNILVKQNKNQFPEFTEMPYYKQ